jgi:hypothetical protein
MRDVNTRNNPAPIHYQLLRTQVYEYQREAMRTGKIRAGMFISINQVVIQGVSTRPSDVAKLCRKPI